MSQEEWVEPRGPHLPDAMTRIPLGVWPFVALALLEAYGQLERLRSFQPTHPLDFLLLVIDLIGALAVPLIGAALFLRHPNAHRTLPSITTGVALLAALTVVDALREPVLQGIVQSELEFEAWMLAGTGYSLIQALIRVFALTYLAIGLEDARQFEDRTRASGIRVLLLLVALAPPLITTLIVWPWPDDQIVVNVINVAAQVVSSLALTYLGWVAFRGWAAREEPNVGWGLVALVAVGGLMVSLLAALLGLVVWMIGPTEGQVPVVFEVYRLLLAVISGLWVALLAAFWLGLPAEPEADEVEVDGDAGAPEPA